MKRLLFALLLSALLAAPVWADAVQIDFLLGSFLDNNAAQLAGGYVYTYAAGTTTPKATYLDADKTQTAANPVVLDLYGRANVYADGLYKLIIKDADGVTIATYDNLEFVSAVNPSSIVTTDLTVSSMTATIVDLKSGTAASMTVDNSLITNSRLSNAAILAAPTLASHPTNLQFVVDYVASFSDWINARISSHTEDVVNPHGTTLTQDVLRAGTLSGSLWTASDTAGFPAFRLLATGSTLFGSASYSELAFSTYFGGAEQDPRVALNVWNVDPPVFYLRMQGLSGWRNQITVDATGSGTVDFGGAALINYEGAQTSQEIYEASATPNIYLGYASATTMLSVVVPASFTAGYYSVDWYVLMNNSNGTSPNIGQCYLLFGGTTIQQTRNYGFASSSHSYDVGEVVGHRILYLKPADLLQITGVTLLSPATNGIQGSVAYICFRYLGATKKAY